MTNTHSLLQLIIACTERTKQFCQGIDISSFCSIPNSSQILPQYTVGLFAWHHSHLRSFWYTLLLFWSVSHSGMISHTKSCLPLPTLSLLNDVYMIYPFTRSLATSAILRVKKPTRSRSSALLSKVETYVKPNFPPYSWLDYSHGQPLDSSFFGQWLTRKPTLHFFRNADQTNEFLQSKFVPADAIGNKENHKQISLYVDWEVSSVRSRSSKTARLWNVTIR